MYRSLLVTVGITFAALPAYAEAIVLTTPEAESEIQLGAKPIQATGKINVEEIQDECRGPCMYKCVVEQGNHKSDLGYERWEGPPVAEPSCTIPAKAQLKFHAGKAHVAIYFVARDRVHEDMTPWFMPYGNDVTLVGGVAQPRTPMEKLVARRDWLYGPKNSTATSQGKSITYREAIASRRWKPLSTALSKIKRGTSKPESWDSTYEAGVAERSNAAFSCPGDNRDELAGIKVQHGTLQFQILVDDTAVPVSVALAPGGVIHGTVALPKQLRASAGFDAVTVDGTIENDDSVYKRDTVRFGRLLQIQVTPKNDPESGCALRASAADYIESRPCVPRGEAITLGAVHRDGFNSMERCCRGSRANDAKAVCE